MTCPNPNCKTTGIPDDAKYCPVCGTPLVEKAQPSIKSHNQQSFAPIWWLLGITIVFIIIIAIMQSNGVIDEDSAIIVAFLTLFVELIVGIIIAISMSRKNR